MSSRYDQLNGGRSCGGKQRNKLDALPEPIALRMSSILPLTSVFILHPKMPYLSSPPIAHVTPGFPQGVKELHQAIVGGTSLLIHPSWFPKYSMLMYLIQLVITTPSRSTTPINPATSSCHYIQFIESTYVRTNRLNGIAILLIPTSVIVMQTYSHTIMINPTHNICLFKYVPGWYLSVGPRNAHIYRRVLIVCPLQRICAQTPRGTPLLTATKTTE